MSDPLAYFITFTCYGNWLHGDERGSVDRNHNALGYEVVDTDAERQSVVRGRMTQPPYRLKANHRGVVLASIKEVCSYRGWRLWAAHVRVQHVHVVVSAEAAPEKVMNYFKTYASRALNRAGLEDKTRHRWTRHGSTRYVNDESHLTEAIEYVLERQGELMETFDGRVEERTERTERAATVRERSGQSAP